MHKAPQLVIPTQQKAGSRDEGLGTGMIHVLANVYCSNILKLLATAEAQQNKQDHSAKHAITCMHSCFIIHKPVA